MTRVKSRIMYIGVDLNSRNIDIAATGDEIPLRVIEHMLPVLSKARIREPNIINVVGDIYVAHIYTTAPGSETYYINATVSFRILRTLLREISKLSSIENIPILCIENLCTATPRRKMTIVEKISDMFITKILESSRLVDTIVNNPLNLKKRTSIWGLVYACRKYRTGILIIDPYLTTRLCSACLYDNEITLCKISGRYVTCPSHGKMHRDVNAATNMVLLCKRAVENGLPPAGPSPAPWLHGGWWGSCRRHSDDASVELGSGGLFAGGRPWYCWSCFERAVYVVDSGSSSLKCVSFLST
ncbi:MAG: transposase [Crenarchaeota archaeon]|nr:transposase [Thermoproteota archaeon]